MKNLAHSKTMLSTMVLLSILLVISFSGLALAASAQPTATPNFAMNAVPSYVTITDGSSGTSTIDVASLNDFSGSVSLSAVVPTDWPAAVFAKTPISVTSGSSGSSMMTIAVPSGTDGGNYKVVVTGDSGSVTHSLTVTIHVPTPNFAMNAVPSYVTINGGSSGTSTIAVISLNGFSSSVSMSVVVPTGWSAATLNPTSITPLSGGSSSSTLTITVPSDATAGNYKVLVTGTSGSLTHSLNVTVHVTK